MTEQLKKQLSLNLAASAAEEEEEEEDEDPFPPPAKGSVSSAEKSDDAADKVRVKPVGGGGDKHWSPYLER